MSRLGYWVVLVGVVAATRGAGADAPRLSTDEKVDNTAAIQEALDAVPEDGNLVLPAGRYRVDGPVFVDRSGVGIIGADAGTTLWGKTSRPRLAVGFDSKFGLESWVKLDGLGIDAGLAPPGKALGINLGKVACVLTSTPAEFGPSEPKTPVPTFWAGTRQLTVATVLVPYGPIRTAGLLRCGPIGAYVHQGNGVVWVVRTNAGEFRWKLNTPLKPSTPLRLAFLVDLEAGRVEGFVDGRPATPVPVTVGPAWKPGLEFEQDSAFGAWLGNVDRTDPKLPVVMAALRMSRQLERPAGAGDGWYGRRGPKGDFFRFEPPAKPLPYLPVLSDDTRYVQQNAGFFVPLGFRHDVNETRWRNTVERLRLVSNDTGYGALLLVGSVISFRADRLVLVRGGDGIGQVAAAASYPVVIERCRSENLTHAGFRLGFGACRLRDIEVAATGRHAITFLSGGEVEDLFVIEGSRTESVIRVYGQPEGARLILRDALVNYETYKANRLIHFTQGFSAATQNPYLELTNVDFNSTKEVPILLDGSPPNRPDGLHPTAVLNRVGAGSYGLPGLIEVRGDTWEIEMIGPEVPRAPRMLSPPEPEAKQAGAGRR